MSEVWNRITNFFPGQLLPPHTQRRTLIPYAYLTVTCSGMTEQIPLQFVTRRYFYRFNTGIHFSEKSFADIQHVHVLRGYPGWWKPRSSVFQDYWSKTTLVFRTTEKKIELKRVQIFKFIAHCNIHQASPKNRTQTRAHIPPSFKIIHIYLQQLGCHPVAVVILHVNKTRNWLLLNLSREGYMRSM